MSLPDSGAPSAAPPATASLASATGIGKLFKRWKSFTGSFLLVSIVLHLLLGVGATYFIVQRIAAKRALTFQGGPPNPSRSQRSVEHRVQVAKQKQTSSAPAPPKRVAVAGLAKVSLPEMPQVPAATTNLAAAKLGGMGGAGGFGLGPGTLGGGAGTGGGGGGVPFFGLRGGNGLVGTFYDLKQTKDGKPTDMVAPPGEKSGWDGRDEPTNKRYDEAIVRLVRGGMGEGAMASYFRGPTPLYSTQVYIPTINAQDGPKAFNLGDKVQPKRWLVVYRGKVTPPEGGSYRFVGYGDDVLIARLDGRVVFDGSLFHPTKAGRKGTFPLQGANNVPEGETFEVRAGVAYSLEMVIGERPGGEFGVYLLLEKEGGQNAPGPRKLPIFKLAPSPMPPGGRGLPPVEPDTSWSVWRGEPVKSLGF